MQRGSDQREQTEGEIDVGNSPVLETKTNSTVQRILQRKEDNNDVDGVTTRQSGGKNVVVL